MLNTPIIAQLSGNGDRYATIHASAPNFAAFPRAMVATLPKVREGHAGTRHSGEQRRVCASASIG
jgi:hypothetical protein